MLKGLQSWSSVLNNLHEHKIVNVSIATSTLATKYNLIDLASIKSNNNSTGHSILIVKLDSSNYYYYDPIGAISKSVLNKFIPDHSNILCSLSANQAVGNEDCTAYCVREILLLDANRLKLKEFVILSKNKSFNEGFKIVYESMKGVDQKRLKYVSAVEQRIIDS